MGVEIFLLLFLFLIHFNYFSYNPCFIPQPFIIFPFPLLFPTLLLHSPPFITSCMPMFVIMLLSRNYIFLSKQDTWEKSTQPHQCFSLKKKLKPGGSTTQYMRPAVARPPSHQLHQMWLSGAHNRDNNGHHPCFWSSSMFMFFRQERKNGHKNLGTRVRGFKKIVLAFSFVWVLFFTSLSAVHFNCI